ncbi:hypothetical protein J2T13_000445 [Paenibacillus sp. DS2015]
MREHAVDFSRVVDGRAVAVIPVVPGAKHIGLAILFVFMNGRRRT